LLDAIVMENNQCDRRGVNSSGFKHTNRGRRRRWSLVKSEQEFDSESVSATARVVPRLRTSTVVVDLCSLSKLRLSNGRPDSLRPHSLHHKSFQIQLDDLVPV
jgi:hypothetical protein